MTGEKKKGIFSSLFGGGRNSCCNVQVEEIPEKEAKAESGVCGCCGEEKVEKAAEPGTRSGKKKLQILGTGCPKCKQLAMLTEEAAKELGIDYELIKVTDINEIISFGVMATPALAVDGVVKVAGKVPPVTEIKKLIS